VSCTIRGTEPEGTWILTQRVFTPTPGGSPSTRNDANRIGDGRVGQTRGSHRSGNEPLFHDATASLARRGYTVTVCVSRNRRGRERSLPDRAGATAQKSGRLALMGTCDRQLRASGRAPTEPTRNLSRGGISGRDATDQFGTAAFHAIEHSESRKHDFRSAVLGPCAPRSGLALSPS
jgi:hypothetical protein